MRTSPRMNASAAFRAPEAMASAVERSPTMRTSSGSAGAPAGAHRAAVRRHVVRPVAGRVAHHLGEADRHARHRREAVAPDQLGVDRRQPLVAEVAHGHALVCPDVDAGAAGVVAVTDEGRHAG